MYKILFTYDWSDAYGNQRDWLWRITLHKLEIPFLRNHDLEWAYLPNWHARRDKNCMSAEKAPADWIDPHAR